MLIRRESDYAIRCVSYLASKGKNVTMVEEISREMAIPRSFLAKILQKLAKAGLVQSYRGVKGGFRLSMEPRDISLLDIIVAVEGASALKDCALDRKVCRSGDRCSVHAVWAKARQSLHGNLKSCSVAMLTPPGRCNS